MFQKAHLNDFVRESYVHNDINKKLKQYSINASDTIDCCLGINPFGCSPKIKNMILNYNFEDISKYPDPNCSKFKNAVVDYWGSEAIVDKDSIFIGTGSIDILEAFNKAYIDAQSKVLGYCPQFTEYISEVRVFGGAYNYVPLKKENRFKLSIEDILSYMESFKPDIVYIDNPNNPTGQIIDLKDISQIVNYAKVTETIVIIDEAYGDYMDKENSAINLVKNNENLIVTRTFSKGMGLAGIRVGYAVAGTALKENLLKVDIPCKISNFAELLVISALYDIDFINECRKKTRESKMKLVKACEGKYFIGETSLDTPILVLGAYDSEADFYDYLISKGIIAEAGFDFINMGKNYARLRIPVEVEQLIERLI